MVVKIMVPFCIPIIIRHLIFRVSSWGLGFLGFRVQGLGFRD